MSGGGGGGGGINLGPLGTLNLSDTNSMAGWLISPEAGMISQGWFGSGLKEGLNNFTDRTGGNYVVGELNGNNKKRENEWQHLVAQEASDAQAAAVAQRNKANETNDINASNAAATRRVVPGARVGSLNYNPTGGDHTDFLGL